MHKAPHELIKLLLSCTREHAEGIDTCNSYTDKSGIHSDDCGTRVYPTQSINARTVEVCKSHLIAKQC